METKQLNISFYQNIAKVFYAIAGIDKVIRNKEIETLKTIVKKEWLVVDDVEDDFHTDGAYQIEIVFDWLQDKEANAQLCFVEFVEYYREHSTLFTKKIKNLILETTGKIASAFAGKNKSELVMLGNLSIEFKKNKPTKS